jgi:hypothetical protein
VPTRSLAARISPAATSWSARSSRIRQVAKKKAIPNTQSPCGIHKGVESGVIAWASVSSDMPTTPQPCQSSMPANQASASNASRSIQTSSRGGRSWMRASTRT